MGKEDGVPKSPEWAAPITGVPARVIKALADEWASKRTTVVIGNGGPGHPRPVLDRTGSPAGALPGHAGPGQAGANQAKMIEWALELKPEFMSAPKPQVAPPI